MKKIRPELKLGLWVSIGFIVFAWIGCMIENYLNTPPSPGALWLMSINQETGEETWGWWIPSPELKAEIKESAT